MTAACRASAASWHLKRSSCARAVLQPPHLIKHFILRSAKRFFALIIPSANYCTSFERHVLEEMRDACLSIHLIKCSDLQAP